MAEGWSRRLKSDTLEPYSAGIEARALDPLAVKVMAEAGVDISGYRPKLLAQLANFPFDFIVTVCDHANKSCPLFPGEAKRIHVPFEDPPSLASSARTEEEALSHYRHIRDEIRAFVEKLPDVLEEGMEL